MHEAFNIPGDRRDAPFPAVAVAAFVVATVFAGPAVAGGGPEGVLLVVNQNRADSKRVANHYVRSRDLPAANVVYLDYKGPLETIGGDAFRQQVLGPVLVAIDRRGLSAQIDTIAYSCGLPWRIDLRSDFPKDAQPPRQLRPIASVTGATFFWQAVMAKSPAYLAGDANYYLSGPPALNLAKCRKLGVTPTRAFRGRYRWQRGGQRVAGGPKARRYLLSTMLGVTTGRGNTVEEVVACLDRAIEAEASPPTGVFCFVENTDIRSKTRHACYRSASEQLVGLGARAGISSGKLPRRGTRVAGMMLGWAKLPLEDADLRIQPGAICEHLTSSAGDLRTKANQTPISELIRRGATGVSGTVAEPYAVQSKFPLPTIHLHYRRGASLAEAFYQSVASPYQLLILGDPLCQPWAPRPTLAVTGFPGGPLASASVESVEPIDFGKPLASQGEPRPTGRPTLEPLASLSKLREPAPAQPSETEPGETGPGDTQPGETDPGDDESNLAAPDEPGATAGELRVTATVTSAGAGSGPGYWELYVDGRLRARRRSGQPVDLKPADYGAGWHEVRCVGCGAGALEPQSRQIVGFRGGDAPGDPPAVTLQAAGSIDAGSVKARVGASGADSLVLLQNAREVGRVSGEAGTISVDAAELGLGPVRLQARAEPSGAMSAPVWLTVE